MSEEVQEQAGAVEEASEVKTEEPELKLEQEPKKAVKFEHNELTFDEAQAEIDAIKARAGQARESLKSVPVPKPVISSYSSSGLGGSASGYSFEDDVPKSKNMLSHLNSHSAMINYKVQAARSLVRKQEDLLRNLARMRENMERSENELGKASDYYSPTRYQSRGYFEKRAESAPITSRRHQVREPSPVFSNHSVEIQKTAETTDNIPATPQVSIASHISATPTSANSYNDYQPDEQFEREMAAIRKRVANLTKQAHDYTTPRYNSYDYDTALESSYLRGGYSSDIYSTPESHIKVKNTKSYVHTPKTHHIHLPARITSSTTHASSDSDATCSYPRNTFTDYLMESLNELDYPYNSSASMNQNLYNNSNSELPDLYADPLAPTVADYSLVY